MECSFKRGRLLWSGVLKQGSYCGVEFQKREVTAECSSFKRREGIVEYGFQKREVMVEWSFKRGKLLWSGVSNGGKLWRSVVVSKGGR